MADWTDADQRQLDQLKAQEKALEAQVEGDPHADAHIAAVSKPARPEDEATRPFSTIRTVIGTGRDILQNVLDTSEALGDLAEEAVPLPMVRFGSRASNGVIDVVSGEAARQEVKQHRQLPSIPDVPGSENAGTAEKIVRSIGSFMVPYAGWAKKFAVAKAGIGVAERVARGAAAGFATDFVNQPPDTTNLASVLKDTFGIDNETLDWLSYHDDENALTQRLKAASTNLPVGIAADGLFELGAKAIRAYGAIKGEAQEAKGIVEAMEHDYGIKLTPREVSTDAEAGVADTPVAAAEPYDSALHVAIKEANPQSWEDIVSFLERRVDDPKLPDAELEELGKIVEDDPENALARLGIEPSKLNWHEFDNPDGIRNLHQSLINIYERIGRKLGRTTEQVSEAQINTAARSFASDAEVLRTLYGATKNLPEILMGARMFVGAHAHTLLRDAEDALEALTKGGGGAQGEAAWQKFLQSFHRHALYLGTVRGAGSEIGRALKSLQFLARTDPKAVEKMGQAGKVLGAELTVPEEQAAEKALSQADNQLEGAMAIHEPAEQIMLLSKLLQKKGDIGALDQFIRANASSPLKRADGVVRETTSNLFSVGTAAYNMAASISMLSLRGLGRWMAAAARLPGFLVGGEQARLARVAAMDAWAYTDGLVSSLGEAVRTAMTEMERHASEEAFVVTDGLGLKNVAKRTAEWNARLGAKKLGKNFERVDMDASHMQLAITPADRRRLAELIDSEGLPQIVFRGLNFIGRAIGLSANALGTLNRAGTVLFINAPDQFMGTVAAKAGAQSAAARLAAARAAELGIEGKALTKYMKARVASLATDVEGWSDNGFEDGYRAATEAAGEHEARSILFQDQIESPAWRRISRAISQAPFASIPFPFPHTPLRILEVSLVDYTPLGLLKRRVRDAILHGPPQQREQALSQLGLGMLMMMMAWKMEPSRDIVGTDGDFTSTARINREKYTFRIGGDVYEFVRQDPIGTVMGLTADARGAWDHVDQNDPEAVSKAKAAWEVGLWAVTANVLSKSYLQSMKALADVFGYSGTEQSGWDKYFKNVLARRIVPGAGLQKGSEAVFDPFERSAKDFQEEVLKNSIGSFVLPPKRDFLGDPEPKNLGERFTGLTWKPESTEPLVRELDRLSFQTKLPSRDIRGVPLNGQQYERLVQLRGQGVEGDFGTMKEALNKLIEAPGYKSLTDAAKVYQMKQIMDGYTSKAQTALLKEDPELLARVLRKVSYDQSRKAGLSDDQLREQNAKLGQELGLTQ
jgi:hypothetical protein